MSIPPVLRSLLLVTALLLAPQAASAATAAAGAATAAAPALTPAEAQQLLSVLNDPAKRAAFTTTLNNMAKAVGAAPPAGSHVPAALPPNSLGAGIILGLDTLGSGFALQGRQFAHALHDFRYLGPWFAGITGTPEQYDLVLGALGRLVAVLALSLAAVAAASVAIRRPIRALGRLAAARPPPPMPDEDLADTDDGLAVRSDAVETRDTRARHQVGFVRMLHALKRVPFAAVHLVLALVPVTVFALTVFLCEAVGVVRIGESLVIVRAAIRSFVVAGLVIAVARTLFASREPTLRLVLVSDLVAHRIGFWFRLMALVGAWGFAAIEVLSNLGLGADTVAAMTKTLVLVEHTLLAMLFFRVRHETARRLQPPRRVRGGVRVLLKRFADHWWLFAIFFDYAFWLVWAAQLRHGYLRLWHFSVETIVVIVAARLLAIAALGQLERLFRIDPDAASRHPWVASRTERYYPVLRQLVAIAVTLVTIVALLQIWGLEAFAWFRHGALGDRMVTALIGILAALLISVLVWEAVNAALERHIDRLARDPDGAPRVARVRTLLPMLRIMLMIFILAVLTLTILSEIGVNIAPLLGGAGIVGVAIGFGSQKLVQDFITGIFLLLENAMQVGDAVTLAGLSGSVEHLSIRTIRLRAGDGSLHTIPFSSVTTVTNSNRGLGNAAVSVDLDPEEDTDRAGNALKALALELREDEEFKSGMLSDLQLWGVNAVGSQAVTLVGQIVCTDSARWGVQREFNRRMKRRFQELGIRLAAPTQNVLVSERATPKHGPFEAVGHDRDANPTNVTNSPPPSALGHDR